MTPNTSDRLDFSPRVTRPIVEECERLGHALIEIAETGSPGRVNRQLVKALADQGLFDRLFTEQTVTATDLCAIRQGLARVSTAAETAFAVQGLGAIPIHLSGNHGLRDGVMPRIRSGDTVAAFALTEPGAGSDAAALSTLAEPDGDGYRVSGEKSYISNAPDADIYTVFARTTPGAGSRGITAFVVDREMPGVSGEPIPMLSPHPLGRIHLDGVFVPSSNVLGEVDHGFRVAMQTLDLFRPSVGAFALGMAEAALRIATGHAMTRTAFGTPISDFQGVSHQLANVRLDIEAAELLVYSAAAAHDGGETETLTGKAAMAKLHATETAQRAVDTAIQVLGARGLEADSTLAHLYLEVRAPRIYEGTSEIQRNIIARELFNGRI
ncbi:MAG TPA: acyl-CoA dehydrogenase family protein [Acidimicrobiia bacterium]|nr:acyl-CoA dehydrogenase family protein [Acidimicrobiia bacterium]